MAKSAEPAIAGFIPKDRVTTLIDSIYAFSMTLLVVTIEIPSKFEHANDAAPVHDIVMSLLPDLYHYFIAFIILAMLWYFHHQQFQHLIGINRLLLCTSIASLAFVCLIPFSTNIAGDYPYDTLGAIIFELNILVIGLITLWQWYYIRNRGATFMPDFVPDQIQREIFWSWVFPVLSLIGLVLAILRVPWSAGIFLSSPLIMAYLYRKAPV
ncbi:MAG: TMEM175 family protein [Methanoregula sp.]|jgi:uncharacterized membrane protein